MANVDNELVNGEEILLGKDKNGVRTYLDYEAAKIWIERYGDERQPRLTVKVRDVGVTDERLNKILEGVHVAAVDCDQLRVQVYVGLFIRPRGGSEAGRQPNFGGVALGCTDADFCK